MLFLSLSCDRAGAGLSSSDDRLIKAFEIRDWMRSKISNNLRAMVQNLGKSWKTCPLKMAHGTSGPIHCEYTIQSTRPSNILFHLFSKLYFWVKRPFVVLVMHGLIIKYEYRTINAHISRQRYCVASSDWSSVLDNRRYCHAREFLLET